jgi:hypothetical protein
MHYILMLAGVFFSVLSIFTFSMGWEMWRDSLKNGSLVGMVEITSPEVKLNIVPLIKLVELDGLLISEQTPREDGNFLFTKIKPGQYLLNITGTYIHCPQKTVNIFPSRDSDIGKITCSLNENQYWEKLFSHSQITSTIIANDNTIWTTGFRTDKQYHNSYVLFHLVKDSNKWIEVVVPEINNAERGSVLHQFETGEICLGTNGKGSILSKDNGVSWEKIELPTDVSSINYISELPGNKWLIFGRRLDVKYGKTPTDKPQSVIFISETQGKSWNLLSEQPGNITTFIRHSSGRLIVGTDSVYGDASLFYSEDGGISWVNSKIHSDVILRGIGTISELRDGSLIAGTQDGKSWKNTHLNGGEFLKGGRFLKSDNGGKDWIVWAGSEAWGSVTGLIQLDDSTIMASEGGNLLWSVNNGANWFHFGKSQSFWVNRIIEHDSRIIISGNSAIVESPKEKLIFNYLRQ